MTLRIEVTVPEDEIRSGASTEYLTRAMAAIGFSRGVSLPMPAEAGAGKSFATLDEAMDEVLADEGPNYAAMKAAAEETQEEAPAEIRYLGQPGEGRKRRSKEEMALDTEAEELLEKVGITTEKFNAALDKAGGDWDAVMADLRAAADGKPADEGHPAAKANISTGEERVDPGEAAEALTHDDVRAALGDYAAKFGMPAAQKNGPKLMGADKISAIPDDQAALRKAVDAIRERIEKGEA